MIDSESIGLHLRCRVSPGRRDEFIAFLREATPYYEAPGGISVRLLEDLADDHRFIELVLYEDDNAYRKDQVRVASDTMMKSYLDRWRALLSEPPVMEVYRIVKA